MPSGCTHQVSLGPELSFMRCLKVILGLEILCVARGSRWSANICREQVILLLSLKFRGRSRAHHFGLRSMTDEMTVISADVTEEKKRVVEPIRPNDSPVYKYASPRRCAYGWG